ncbi:hypothetical protein COO60DRAFT_1486870 [Scenedesmus sp. NREL 46B-D3]|nr:hypothetical protein COO60DRAFT_1486870 [Scenedesmus sp. NREL 46B-D3]
MEGCTCIPAQLIAVLLCTMPAACRACPIGHVLLLECQFIVCSCCRCLIAKPQFTKVFRKLAAGCQSLLRCSAHAAPPSLAGSRFGRLKTPFPCCSRQGTNRW